MEWLLLLVSALIAWYGSSAVKMLAQISKDADEIKIRMSNIDLLLKQNSEEINAQISSESWALKEVLERNPHFRKEPTNKHEV